MPVRYPHDFEVGALNPWSDVLGIAGKSAGQVLGQSPGYLSAPFLQGVVLYAWKEEAEPETFSESDPLNIRQVKQETVYVKVRVPEIHNLPIPLALPYNNNRLDSKADWDAINRYPSFQATDAEVIMMPIPLPGDIVKVDFRNRPSKVGPIYLGPVKESVRPSPSTIFQSSAMEAFNQVTGPTQRISNVSQSPELWFKDFMTDNSEVRLVSPNSPYTENRVRAGAFASLPKSSPLLVEFEGGALVHKLFADRLRAMNNAWRSETGGRPFKSSNGWRPGPEARYAWLKQPSSRRFKRFARSTTSSEPHVMHYAKNLKAALRRGETNHYKLWEAMLLDEYNGDLRLGKIRRAWNSPHQSGLAIDFKGNGLTPMTKQISVARQRESKAFKWLVKNAYKFGINPYKKEPWHWECVIPRENFLSGEEFSPDSYDVRVVETNKTTGKTTAHYMYAKKEFT